MKNQLYFSHIAKKSEIAKFCLKKSLYENQIKSTKIYENQRKSMKIHENLRKSKKI